MGKTDQVPSGSNYSMKPELNFESRSEFPAFLNECGLTGTGAEIGVQEGIYSEHILKT